MYKTMHNLRNRSKDKKGFTLAELLIVVAIIAVLVAIAVPIFSGQLEKAREATDVANIRTAYAVATIAAMEQSKDVYAVVELTQK
ncbi:MAG: prepilin-type N-terminal cleavage/methylation domain-containing protein [Peptococcaceae bacterium]|nr:prepilin-type N-terminal cleavage/methylation domain-containing protein [Peptococcaceae bacterium]